MLPLICVDCGRLFADKEVTEETVDQRTKTKTKVTRIKTAVEQAEYHYRTSANDKGVSRKHHVVPVSQHAWDAGLYESKP